MSNSLVSKYEIVEVWNGGNNWKLGIENSKNVLEVMESLGLEFSDTPHGREIRDRVQSAINQVPKILHKEGLLFGGIKLSRGTKVRYLIAEKPEEYRKIHNQSVKRYRIAQKKNKSQKELIQLKIIDGATGSLAGEELQKILALK